MQSSAFRFELEQLRDRAPQASALTAARIGLARIGALFLDAAVLLVDLDCHRLRIGSRYPGRVPNRLFLARSPGAPDGLASGFPNPLIVFFDDVDSLHDPSSLPSITRSDREYPPGTYRDRRRRARPLRTVPFFMRHAYSKHTSSYGDPRSSPGSSRIESCAAPSSSRLSFCLSGPW